MKIAYFISATLLFQLLLLIAYYLWKKKKYVIGIIIGCFLGTPFIFGLVLWNVVDMTNKEMFLLLLVNGIISILSAVLNGIREMRKISK